ncbi:MAG: hypothetical protein BGO78_03865 [Chloroflexi bacterium 44-23]|nr:MAG: hypothetical protein BGO78_03865 [Chloroflexi bacterium 44-23]
MAIFEPTKSNQSTFSERFIEKLRGQNLSLEEYSIDDLLQRSVFLPEKMALLGLDADKLPVTFDLRNEQLGSLLILNDHLPTIRHLMYSMIRSLQQMNSAFEFQYIVISDLPEKWMSKIHEYDCNYDFCAGVVGGDEESAEDWIIYLAQKVEQRHQKNLERATIILFVDDLAMVERMDTQTRKNFEWLVKYGASVNIWVFAGLDFLKINQPMLFIETFKSRIFGQMDPVFSPFLSGFVSESQISALQIRNKFLAKIGVNWIPFWAPILQG